MGGAHLVISEFDGERVLMVGGSGGLHIGKSLMLGGGGYGFEMVQERDGSRQQLEGGYGGLLIEYSPLAHELLHLTASTLIGGGGLTRQDQTAPGEGADGAAPTAYFFAVQPAMVITTNVTPFLRMSLEVAYRLVLGANEMSTESQSLSGPGIGLELRVGSF